MGFTVLEGVAKRKPLAVPAAVGSLTSLTNLVWEMGALHSGQYEGQVVQVLRAVSGEVDPLDVIALLRGFSGVDEVEHRPPAFSLLREPFGDV